MAEYTARTWSNGDIVTATNLNQIENGVESASQYLIVNDVNEILDKTFRQIKNAFPNVVIKVSLSTDGDTLEITTFPSTIVETTSLYTVVIGDDPYSCPTQDDYPAKASFDDGNIEAPGETIT